MVIFFRLLMFLCIFSCGSVDASQSFKECYDNADVMITYRDGHLSVTKRDGNVLNDASLRPGESVSFRDSSADQSDVCVSLSLSLDVVLSITNICNSTCSYAIDSDTAVNIVGNNMANSLMVRSDKYISNCSNLMVDSFTFYSPRIFNFAGIGERVDSINSLNIDSSLLDQYSDSAVYNFGAVKFNNIEATDLAIRQSGRFTVGRLLQRYTNDNYSKTCRIDIEHDRNSRCKLFTRIESVDGTGDINVSKNCDVVINNWQNGSIRKNASGFVEYSAHDGRSLNYLEPQSDRRSCGIENLCGTCYMSAAIQFLYAMDSLRDYIFRYDGNDQILCVLRTIFESLRDKCRLSRQELMKLYKEILMWQNGFYNRSLNVSDGWFREYGNCEELLFDLLRYFMNVSGLGGLAKSVSEDSNSDDCSKLHLRADFCPYVNDIEGNVTFSQHIMRAPVFTSCKQLGDYVIVGNYKIDGTGGGGLAFDDFKVNGVQYEPIACISQDKSHSWARIKQLDGGWLCYDDIAEVRDDELDEHSMLALYKRVER